MAKTTEAKKAVVRKAKPSAAPAKAEKPAKAKAAKAEKKMPEARPSRLDSKSETVREIVRLASRPEGATAKELEAASGWKNAGWPWMFHNKNTGKGIASRYQMRFEVIERAPENEGERARKAYRLSPL